MDYNSLIAAKGTSGALATWVNYTLLDTPTIVAEAQAMLYGEARLRCREMQTMLDFTMAASAASYPLPSSFLEPIGRIECTSFNSRIRHKDAVFVHTNRVYSETSGSLSQGPFTTTAGSNTVTVTLVNHGFTQGSVFYTTGANTFNGVTIAGTFPINGILDANDFSIDITSLGATPTAGGNGGGASVSYICDVLASGTPLYFAVTASSLIFDQAFFQTSLCRLAYYQSLPLLAPGNPTNFLTSRYPNLLRTACMAAAADFMKDSDEYQKQWGHLTAAIEKVAAENDMQYRGLELDPEIP